MERVAITGAARGETAELPGLKPRRFKGADAAGAEAGFQPRLLAAVLCGLLGLTGAMMRESAAALPLYLGAYAAGGWFTAIEVWALLRKRVLDVHFLMLLVAAGSASIGAWGEGATLLFLFSLSGALEQYAMGRTHREIDALFKGSPKTATLIQDNEERIIPVEQVQPGMILLLRPGDMVPVDGMVETGRTACDESTLTGESAPAEKDQGDAVYAGTINLWGSIRMRASRPASSSTLQKVIELIQEAQRQKAPSQRFTDRFSAWYTYAVLAGTALMFLLWWRVFGLPLLDPGDGSRGAFYRAMTLLVVSSPCALVLSIPSAILSSIAFGARRGILFRGGAAVERLGDTTIVAMDKTGTVTTGDLRVTRVESFPSGHERELTAWACALESLSTHPLARAIAAHGRALEIEPPEVEGFESVAGAGLRGLIGGEPVLLGKRDWLRDQLPPISQSTVSEPGAAEVWLVRGSIAGLIELRDELRPEAKGVVDRLHELGLGTVLLTGDRAEPAERARALLGIRQVRGGLRPEDKLRFITDLKREGEIVSMIGDGVNDAPSLAAADIGVAMGARGSDAALEQADIVLMRDRIEQFLTAFELSRRARRVISQNLVISLGTVAVLAVFAILGKIPLALAVVGHEGSTVLVILNSLRLLRAPAK